jgi:hypothetical protein
MKFLKTKNISKSSVSDKTFIVNTYGRISTNSTNSFQIPSGTTAQRPQTSLEQAGQMRYNEETLEFEMFIDNDWRNIRFKEASLVSYQTFPGANDTEILFGILDPAPPATIQDGVAWSGAQLMVYVENVFQLFNTNYKIIQNPCNITTAIVSFDSIPKTITSSNTAIIDFVELGFHAGQTIVITGSEFNDGTYTVDTVTSSVITVLESLATEAQGFTITIVGRSTITNSTYPSGYYVKFFEPVPSSGLLSGEPINVTVISGFDK